MKRTINTVNSRYVCAGERLKLIGTVNGFFPDMGHHLAKEMNGMWLHPIKLLDGFWLRLADHDSNGEVDCWINSDSFTNFPYGNKFEYRGGLGHTPIHIDRFQFSPDETGGCVVSYRFMNRSMQQRRISFEFLVRTDLRPVWHSEKIGIYDGKNDIIRYDKENRRFHAKDCDHEWHVMFGFDAGHKPDKIKTGQLFGPEVTAGNGVSASMEFSMVIGPLEEKTVNFYFGGSYVSEEDCLMQYEMLKEHELLLEKKKQRCEAIRNKSNLATEDKDFDEIYSWIKINNDWLVQSVPGIGRGLTAGIPEYPWWFGCDSCYSVMGLLGIGEAELAKQTLDIVLKASERENENGRIVHEVITNGTVWNLGNTQETAHFIYALWEYYQWTGDLEFVKRCYPYMRKSIDWLIEMDDDKDLFPSGYGVLEIDGLNMELIDTAVYTCLAFHGFSKMSRLIGDDRSAKAAEEMHQKIKKAINDKFWIEDRGLYGDVITSADTVEKKLDQILFSTDDSDGSVRAYLTREIARRKEEAGESSWLLNEAWVTATPMETGIAPEDHARIALEQLYTERFIGKYGAYLSGLNHKHTMTISTGSMAVAQARYGNPDRALDLMTRMFSTFGMATPGCISEMSPDYGCFVQGWTIFGVGVTIVKYFFGIQPDAYNKVIVFSPYMPARWNKASLKNVEVLGRQISIEFERKDGKEYYYVTNKSDLKFKIANHDVYVTIDGKQV